jgi:hypothetical protein
MAQPPALIEDGVHEPVRRAVDLSLGERPELDRLDAARQRVRQAAQSQHARRPGEQVAAGPGVGVDLFLDGEQEVGHALDLVDHHQPGGVHEAVRIHGRRLAGRRGVEVAPLGVPALGHQAEQRAFPALAGAGDEDDPRIRQRLGEGGL